MYIDQSPAPSGFDEHRNRMALIYGLDRGVKGAVDVFENYFQTKSARELAMLKMLDANRKWQAEMDQRERLAKQRAREPKVVRAEWKGLGAEVAEAASQVAGGKTSPQYADIMKDPYKNAQVQQIVMAKLAGAAREVGDNRFQWQNEDMVKSDARTFYQRTGKDLLAAVGKSGYSGENPDLADHMGEIARAAGADPNKYIGEAVGMYRGQAMGNARKALVEANANRIYRDESGNVVQGEKKGFWNSLVRGMATASTQGRSGTSLLQGNLVRDRLGNLVQAYNTTPYTKGEFARDALSDPSLSPLLEDDRAALINEVSGSWYEPSGNSVYRRKE